MYYMLFYEVVDGYVEKRQPFRPAHLERAEQAVERGELMLGGALANPVDMSLLLFRGDSPRAAESFARDDPYVLNGLVKKWYIRQWNVVIGTAAESPAL